MQLVGLALALAGLAAGEALKKLDTSLTILVHNDLQGTANPDADSPVILTDAGTRDDITHVCDKLGETLWSSKGNNGKGKGKGKPAPTSVPFADYLQYDGRASKSSKFWVSSGPGQDAVDIAGKTVKGSAKSRFPGFCTNSAPFSNQSGQDTGKRWQVSLDVNGQTLTGFRDRLSFRFLGIRYAKQPKRFTYPTLFKGSGEDASALEYGSQCIQFGTGSEDCLFLNVWTPHLPNPNTRTPKKKLLPVGLWIHGGAFTGGTANDPTFDGANIVSRGGMVLVAINYRLLAFGFLALKDGKTNGNFGLADQITALDWVREHIHNFGGDKDRITVFGQSAGAGSVRALIASPKAVGKFSGAIMLSNLGGINYGTTYSEYYTIDEQVDVAAKPLLAAFNCTGPAASQADCLRAIPASDLSQNGNVRYLVVDGTYLTTPHLPVTAGGPLPLKLMMGTTAEDGAPFLTFPTTTNKTAYLTSSGFDVPSPQLFPITPTTPQNDTLSLYNTASRLATDGIFRCIDTATASSLLHHNRLKEIYYYEFDRTYQTKGWPGTDVCDAPRTPTHPEGDPTKPYLRCHSGELYYVFGNLARQELPVRDEGDLVFERFVLDSFAAFVRTGEPNAGEGWLRARGYGSTLGVIKETGRWTPSTKGDLTIRVLDYPKPVQAKPREGPQCESLGLGVDFYEK